MAPSVWNSLPTDLRNLPILCQFKSNLKTTCLPRLSRRSSSLTIYLLLLLLLLSLLSFFLLLLFLSSSEGMLSTPGDFPAFGLRTASSTSSFSTGRLSASCERVWLLWSRLVSGWSSQLYRSLQYSVYWFRTALLFVRMFPLLSSMTADLCCWLLLRTLRVLLLTSFASLCSSFAAFIFLLASLFPFLCSSPASVLVCQNFVCDPRLNLRPLSPKDPFSCCE